MVKQIYWIEVLRRKHGTLEEKEVIESYPFPDVPFEPFGFDLLLFKDQIDKIEDDMTRLATLNRYQFITEIWHPYNFYRVVRKPWKYTSC